MNFRNTYLQNKYMYKKTLTNHDNQMYRTDILIESEYDYIYIIHGLRRSGNHLAIQWIMSHFEDNSILLLNNIKMHCFENYKDCLILQNEFEKKAFGEYDAKLYDVETYNSIIHNSIINNSNRKFNILILTLEDKNINKLIKLQSMFKSSQSNQKHTIIIIRDLLNTLGSRLQFKNNKYKEINQLCGKKQKLLEETQNSKIENTEIKIKIKNIKNKIKNISSEIKKMPVDNYTKIYWSNNLSYALNNENQNNNIHIFNYNKFITNDYNYKTTLASNLSLPNNNVGSTNATEILPTPNFGDGSSFGSENKDYLNRWKDFKTDEFITDAKDYLNDNEINDKMKEFILPYNEVIHDTQNVIDESKNDYEI